MADKQNNPTPAPSGKPNTAVARLMSNNDVVFAIGLAVILATLLIPLPTMILDMLISCSIAVALATLVVVLSARESIEFSAFPSLLLSVTLFRLSLNVASTRLILLQGDAGQIIHTFGDFVVGGNLIVGLVVFLILVVIQFVVITKGAERISEVAARFNLDAMPGKQMAIDADLSAGLIDETQASRRREKIVRESEFYGSMDGASKFIRGDAIAGLIITAVNLVGGFIIGTTRGMTLGEAITTYSILTVGDGLVTQIPALIISTSSGFLISKSSSKKNISQDLIKQMLARSRPLGIVSFLLAAMIFVPGFPKTPFIVLSIGAALAARSLGRQERAKVRQETKKPAQPTQESEPIEELLDVDRISIQVGSRLVKTVDPRRNESVSHRIAPLRRKFARQYGLVLPLVRLRDSVGLAPNDYEIRLYNHVISSGSIRSDKYLAMDPGMVKEKIEGEPAQEPVFNLPALWITPEKKEQAELNGYTVVDPETVLITHLAESLKRHAHELLSRDDVQTLVDRLKQKEPALVEETIGKSVGLGLLQRVLQNLLRNDIPIKDLRQIVESLGDYADRTKDPEALTEMVRKALVRTITEQHTDNDGRITAITLDAAAEYDLCGSLGDGEGGLQPLEMPPQQAMELVNRITEKWKQAMEAGRQNVVMLCEPRLRPNIANLLARQLPQLPVLAYDEIAIGTPVDSAGTITFALEQDSTADAPAGLPQTASATG